MSDGTTITDGNDNNEPEDALSAFHEFMVEFNQFLTNNDGVIYIQNELYNSARKLEEKLYEEI